MLGLTLEQECSKLASLPSAPAESSGSSCSFSWRTICCRSGPQHISSLLLRMKADLTCSKASPPNSIQLPEQQSDMWNSCVSCQPSEKYSSSSSAWILDLRFGQSPNSMKSYQHHQHSNHPRLPRSDPALLLATSSFFCYSTGQRSPCGCQVLN